MLKAFFNEQDDVLERLQSNPLHAYLDAFASALVEDAYAASTVRSKLLWVAELGWWLQEEPLPAAQLSEHTVDRYLKELRRRGRLRRGQASTLLRFVGYLQGQGIIPRPDPVCDTSPRAELERHYERYLRSERGLTTATVVNYLPVAHRFLVQHFGDGPLRLEQLCGADIAPFVLAQARCQGAKRAQLMVSALRSFLRFLFQAAKIEVDLAACCCAKHRGLALVVHTQIPDTTHVYAEFDLEMKAKALEKCDVSGDTVPENHWADDASLMAFLQSL